MGIRTVEQYKESLRDGRRVYISGEKVEDITTHPILGISCDTIGAGYELTASKDPDVKNLFVAPHPETGEPINRLFITPAGTEDLANRTKMIQQSIKLTGGLPFGKDIGTDCLNAAFVVAGQMGKKEYQENARNFLEHLRANDLHTCGAVSCVKGDRSKEPARQKHPDYYLRVVEKNADGIVVKGAKIHITSAPAANEIIVVPTRQMRENEGDYAVSFAIPANTEGVTFICRGGRGAWSDREFHPDRPVRELTEAMIVFDNVFVPWERVFMCGEWQFTRNLAYAFASYHRLFGTCKMIGKLEIITGTAALLAEYNGVETVSHVRKKLAWMAMITETVALLGKAACLDPISEFGHDVVMPNRMAINASKYTFASNFHSMCQHLQDIAGGLSTTVPTFRDWNNPEIRPYIEKYLSARDGVPTEHRIRAMRLAKDMTCNFYQIDTIHGEGSMAAQEMFLYGSADWKKLKSAAKRAAHIDGWQDDPTYGKLLNMKQEVAMPPVDESYRSIPVAAEK